MYKCRIVLVILAVAAAACSTATTNNGAPTLTQMDGGQADASMLGEVQDATGESSADAVATADAAADTVADAAADAAAGDATNGDLAAADAVADAAAQDDAATDAIDWDLLDPEDTADGTSTPDTAPVNNGLGAIYAHTSSMLYRLENKQFTTIGQFKFNKSPGSVTDIALDDNGALYAVTFDDVFQCDKKTAQCTWLAALPQQFNGLTFVPKDVATPGKPALIGIANSGDWNLIEVAGGVAKVSKLGSYGSYSSSGDAFSVEGIGTYATVKSGFGGSDKLVQVNPANGSVLKLVGDTGVSDLWGVAWQAGVLYGFSSSGAVYALDVNTGAASPIAGLQVPSGVSWWGAGVSTRAADN